MNSICCSVCNEPIENNQGTYRIKGTGVIFARGLDVSTILYAHWGECGKILDKYLDQFPPEQQGDEWFWGHLPFRLQPDEETTNLDKFIYVLKSGKHYKIGITKDVKKRMGELKTGDPIKHLFVCSSFFENAGKFEKRLHEAFNDYRGQGEWFKLPAEKLEELINILENGDFMDKVLPLDNVVYYHPGTRVLWCNRPGIVHSLVIKTYKYQVGYNILLDTQSSTDEPKVLNSSYGELVLEDSGIPSQEGYEV